MEGNDDGTTARPGMTLTVLAAVLALAGLLLSAQALRSPAEAVVEVEWSTASELDTVGFNLYRASTSDGPYTQINDALIPSADDPLTGEDYRYVDRNVEPGRTYYYQLEDIEHTGMTTRHGPTAVTAQRPAVLDRWLGPLLLALALLIAARDVVRRTTWASAER